LEKLESRLGQVGNSAILIGTLNETLLIHRITGQQLDSLDRQKNRASESKDLVLYFLELNKGDTARLDLVKHSHGWEGKSKVRHG
jgi:hypothetical protein